jgi:hypothetical protein
LAFDAEETAAKLTVWDASAWAVAWAIAWTTAGDAIKGATFEDAAAATVFAATWAAVKGAVPDAAEAMVGHLEGHTIWALAGLAAGDAEETWQRTRLSREIGTVEGLIDVLRQSSSGREGP